MYKRVIALLLAMTMLGSLTACFGENDKILAKPVIEIADLPKVTEETKPYDPNIIEFDPYVVLVDNEDVKIELMSFHQELHKWTDRGECLDKHFNIKITRKDVFTFYPGRTVNISDLGSFSCNIGERKMSIMIDNTKNWEDGKTSIILANENGSSLDSLEELYALEGVFIYNLKCNDKSIGSVEFPFSVADAMKTYEAQKNATDSDSVFSAGNVTVDAIAVDDAYQDPFHDTLKMVYLFYTVEATDTNLKADSTDIQMTVNEKNTYTSGLYFDAGDYASTYINSHAEADIYMGTSKRFVANFKVPEADLQPGRRITFSDSRIPGMEKIILSTDDIKHYDGASTLCNAITPLGFAFAYYARNYADDNTTKLVRNYLSDTTGTIREGNEVLQYAFSPNGGYSLRNSKINSNGIYIVTNYYVMLVDMSTNRKITEMPYTIVNGQVGITIPDINLERTN